MNKHREIRQVTFKGSHFERGLQRGKALRHTLTVPPVTGVTPEFVRGCLDATGEAFSPAIEEFEGIVQGGEFNHDALMAYYFARIESRLGGCTMFAATPERRDGSGAVVGRNYDWAVSDLRWCELHRFETPSAPRCIGYTHHWAGCPDMLSENGLYVAIASLPPEDISIPGIEWNVVVDMLAERCTTVKQAAEACASVRHLRPMSYLLGDAQGAIGVVEARTAELRFRAAQDGVVIAANSPQGGTFIKDWTTAPPPYALQEPIRLAPPNYKGNAQDRAVRRIHRAAELLTAMPSISEVEVKTVLSDHSGHVCAGDHTQPDGGRWATIWSGICEPAVGRFLIAPGLPCQHEYQEFRC